MLTYDLNKKDNKPLYEILYTLIKNDILNGRLKENEKLPSKRRLSKHLKLSVTTVEGAYEQLKAEGYIYSREKSGYFVSSLGSAVYTIAVNDKKHDYIPKNKETEKNVLIDFKSNDVSGEKFPFTVWSRLMREVLTGENKNLLKPVPFSGVYELRQAIADFLYRFRGISVSPEQIVIGAGTEYLYNLLIQLFGRDNIYAVENPGYGKIASIYKINGIEYRYINLDENGLSINELNKSDANIIHISPSHHFPTGTIMSIKRRRELLRWAQEKENRYILEDDYDSEFRFSGRPVQMMKSIDSSDRVVYINTFTKTIAPSIRISYMILPPPLYKKFKDTMKFYSCTVPSFEQYTLARFLSEGYFEKHLNRMKSFYRTQRDTVIDAFYKSSFGDKIKIYEQDSGLHFLMSVKSNKSDKEIKDECLKNNIVISCLSDYEHTENVRRKNTFVINYSGIDCKKLRKAVDVLGKIF